MVRSVLRDNNSSIVLDDLDNESSVPQQVLQLVTRGEECEDVIELGQKYNNFVKV